MKISIQLLLLTSAFLLLGWQDAKTTQAPPPNIVYILADDMGYGDMGCLNEEGKIPTPNMDRLAREGMIFTDMHSNSAVCTPTRYGILTGRYAWRTRLQSGVLYSYDAPLIEKTRLTVPALLKRHGYATACVGKWHLGWTWQTSDDKTPVREGLLEGSNILYDREILNGPCGPNGFDYFFGIPASLDMSPYVYVENSFVVEAPSERMEAGKGYAFFRGGPAAPGFKHEEVLPRCTQKAVEWIDNHARSAKDQPFFLYFPLNAPHTPIVPAGPFQGKTGLGPYGDFVFQCDWTVGRIMDTLEKQGLADNTLIIVTSDNGCSPTAKFKHLEEQGHDPCYRFRGAKADIYEGGHRTPFIARWPLKIKAGSTCTETCCLTDLMATVAGLVGCPLEDGAGVDSVSMLPLMLGASEDYLREGVVHHSINGSFSIRMDQWKLILCPGSGGWSHPTPGKAAQLGLPMLQLYDLSSDIGETNNLQDQHPDVVHRLLCLLERYIENGRSTMGPPQKNSLDPDIWKALARKQTHYRTLRVSHLATASQVEILNRVPYRYSDHGRSVLTDGVKASLQFKDGHWLGVEGEDLELKIDLGKSVPLRRIELAFLEDQNSWIFPPAAINLTLINEAGKRIAEDRQVGEEIGVCDTLRKKTFVQDYRVDSVRQIHIKVESLKSCPNWHKGAGGKAWVFMDEIVVN